jgi:hypothetical protein
MKAILKIEFKVSVIFPRAYDDEDYVLFEEGMEVEVIKNIGPNPAAPNHTLFIVYSEELNESTVVSGRFLEFL